MPEKPLLLPLQVEVLGAVENRQISRAYFPKN
jgi:hypothetical protein